MLDLRGEPGDERGAFGHSIHGLGLARPHRRRQFEKLVMREAHRQLDLDIGPGFQFHRAQHQPTAMTISTVATASSP
ncbi:hypothetical protein C3007_09920 [Avibacterium gallinarum]|nr:hypothetical protein C3007_09920 [Avibacterium gallinarum]